MGRVVTFALNGPEIAQFEWEVAKLLAGLAKCKPYDKSFIEFKGLMSIDIDLFSSESDPNKVLRLRAHFSDSLTETAKDSDWGQFYQDGNYMVQEYFGVPEGAAHYIWAKVVIQRVRQHLTLLGYCFAGQSDNGNLRATESNRSWMYDLYRPA